MLGMNRRVYRVAAYATPFRLDMGAEEPPTGTAPGTGPTMPVPAAS
jgi:hypothetical protein